MGCNRRTSATFRMPIAAGIAAVCCSGLVQAGQGTYPMGEIGGRVALVEKQPGALEVKEVYPDLPGARAKLQPGALIVGAAGQSLTGGYLMPLKQLGFAIDAAHKRDGKLALQILKGKTVETVTVQLSTAPGFSATFPFNCPRTEAIYNHVCERMSAEYQKKGSLPGGPVTNSLAVMALLGHKSGEGLKIAGPYIERVAKGYASGETQERSVWLLSYHGVMLCESFLMHPDPVVSQAIQVIAKRLADNIPSHGRFGHHVQPDNRDGVAYGGQGLNATTTAALWFFASAVRCGLKPEDIQPAFSKALDRVQKETNANGGVGYAWGGDHQSPMRSGQTALAWYHLVMSPQLIGPITSAQLNYRAKVATWPTRHADDLLEAHAVSSLGIATSTAGLASFDRQQYQGLMSAWKWYFALAWQPNPAATGQFEVAYVGGPNNTGGDYYLNGHRPLEKDFCSIMYATVGFILASSDERLSFYGGMPPIPGLTTTALARSPQLNRAFQAARQNNFALALRLATPLTEDLTENGVVRPEPPESSAPPEEHAEAGKTEATKPDATTTDKPQATKTGKAEDTKAEQAEAAKAEKLEIAKVALAFIEFIDERVLAAQYDYIDSLFDGQDVALAYTESRRFSNFVKGIQKYEIDVTRLLDELNSDKYAERIRIGKRFYALKAATSKGKNLAAAIKNWERFKETCNDDYYRGESQSIVDELRKAEAFDKDWSGKDESEK